MMAACIAAGNPLERLAIIVYDMCNSFFVLGTLMRLCLESDLTERRPDGMNSMRLRRDGVHAKLACTWKQL